jgi:hypothetical protein
MVSLPKVIYPNIHYKESCPYQPICLQLVYKSTIFAFIDVTILHGMVVKTNCSNIFDYKWFYVTYVTTIINLNENEDENCVHIIHN